MRIVIDLQGAQAENRKRGIGRYSLSLTKAIVAQRGEANVIVVLSDAFPESIESIRTELSSLLCVDKIKVFSCPPRTRQLGSASSWSRDAAELLREAFILSLEPSVVLVCSLFEGLVDDVVTSVGRLSQRVPTAVILYDLIPLIYRDLYLENWQVEKWYENKLGHLRRADLLLAISDSSSQEAQTYLGLPAERVETISTAADSHFREISLAEHERKALLARFGLRDEFVLYTGGIDHRKNIEGLIRGYGLLAPKQRQSLQLAIVCSIQSLDKERLETLVRSQGLEAHEVIFTGFVSEEELLGLYNLCKVFIFPSWHEGFGLPALEAMSCGRAVIASNSSSLPEVIGCDDALFDSRSDEALAEKLNRVLTDDEFRARLETHARQQARRFSWQHCADRALSALRHLASQAATGRHYERPKLAYVSPLPPLRSGISDYSAELLPELCRFYDVEVITVQSEVASASVAGNCVLRSVEWFRSNANRFDRVLYHFGNSEFHQHMFALLEEIPGVVILHDFFLSGIVAHMECSGAQPGFWINALYESHGYGAVIERLQAKDTADVVWKYPCNYPVVANSQGVIVHSRSSQRMADDWYGAAVSRNWAFVPHLRVPDFSTNRNHMLIRKRHGIKENDFVVCSFGLLGRSKMNDRLLESWLQSSLAQSDNCVLVFVGKNDEGSYGEELQRRISASGRKKTIRITGWTDTEVYNDYLAIADVGVQLRTLSRGETSGAVLDGMNYGLPIIVNANGSMADLPDDCVLKLNDQFSDKDLVNALESLYGDSSRRRELGDRARATIISHHSPRRCAEQYKVAIENFYERANLEAPALVRRIMSSGGSHSDLADYRQLACALDRSLPPSCHQQQILVDVSELVHHDARSGIQRVVRSVLCEWLERPIKGYRIEPVYAIARTAGYRYARRFTLEFLGVQSVLQDEPITFRAGDIFFGLDLQPTVVREQESYYQALHRAGVRLSFLVHDLLPITMPECFLPGAKEIFQQWLRVVGQFDSLICVSSATAVAVRQVMPTLGFEEADLPALAVSHNGGDIGRSIPTTGLPPDATQRLAALRDATSFLMVGTLEPRKAHAQVLDAMEQLWRDGQEAILVIVGKPGWMVDDLVDRLTRHPELNRKLFWFNSISDEYLEGLYSTCSALIAASLDEGFGLPLIEAAQHGLPVIARDISVFKEVAGEHAFYFKADTASELATALMEWSRLSRDNIQPMSRDMPWLSWKASAENLLKILIKA
ncbi:glycosyltransferase [Pseudomonas sp. Snoq117.2]|uniref:glycosyltransferase n=1 Tax=Pseudomonas sp. Snoq117.2 TaxID=1500302 RepID=UPI0008B2466E|nr:glycosyltransferase [Pseudomonas sp. Snoq117.2]SEP46908.1 Glycosyltransferase involved in cell wall bisynthesis [Pseudomonas sp. Snoq117.2]